MPNFSRLQIAFKNVYVRILAVILMGLLVTLAIFKSNVPQDARPVVHSQNIAEITALAGQKARLEYLLMAKPLSEVAALHLQVQGRGRAARGQGAEHLAPVAWSAKCCSRTRFRIRSPRTITWRPHKAVMLDEGESTLARTGTFLKRHALDIA